MSTHYYTESTSGKAFWPVANSEAAAMSSAKADIVAVFNELLEQPRVVDVLEHEFAPVVVVPRSQAYYWSQKWQADERQAVAEIERGETVTFADPQDAVRWLLAADDDEDTGE